MEDYVDPSKDVDSDEYWIAAKRPKALAALRRAFPPAEWDVLTTTIDAQIAAEDKLHPAKWLTKLTSHYLGGEPIIQSTHNFLRILNQEPGMSIQDWHTTVRLNYQKCDFPAAVDDRLQRDIFVIGLNDAYKRFRSDVISHENLTTLTFAQVITKARDFEDSLKMESAISQHHLDEAVNKVSSVKPTHSQQPDKGPNSGSGIATCRWCGRAPHSSRSVCPARNDTCYGCGKRGHWQHVCKGSSAKTATNMKPHSQNVHLITHDVYQVQPASKGIFVDLDVSPSCAPSPTHRVKFQVDSGCSCNTMHITDVNKMNNVQMGPSNVVLRDYSKATIPTKGQANLHCTRRGKSYEVVVQVITSQRYYTPLLGLADSTRMGILTYDVDTVNQLNAVPGSNTPSPPGELTLNYIKHTYPHLFQGLGDLGAPFSLTLNPEIKPIQAAPHRFSAPKLPIIKEALNKLIDSGQLIRVNEPTPWISNMVVRERPASATKPAKVRICLDPSQTVNKAIVRPVYPIPTLEENIHRFHQAKIFSTFDIKDAFQAIKLTEESSMLTTMHTPWGRYRWTRLPFGISSAPEEFQRRIHDVLCGIDGIINIADDIIVMGRGDSMQAAILDHDQTVVELLKRLTQHQLKLNPDKIKLKSHTAPFMGHILTPEGLKPSTEIAKAVLEMPQPRDKAATRRFLGTITYLSKFCPNLSEVVHPLRNLTHVKQDFIWADQHSQAFQRAKHLVSTAPCLRFFDVHAPVVLQVDASDYGLGAALLQPSTNSTSSEDVQWQPVAYSSSSLTPTEQRYAQIEKETLAIVHAFQKFDQLLFGKSDVTVHTDHKPLEVIFNRPLSSAPRRLQSMMLLLQRYVFTVEYRKGPTLHIADTLSRAPLPTTTHNPVHDEMVYRVDLEADNPDLSGFHDATLQDIKAAALTDPEQIELQALVTSGWPANKASVPDLAKPYWPVRHELKSHDGLLFKQDRVIIPSSLRQTILSKLHAAHRGSEFTTRHAHSCVFWPGLTNQITNMCKTCPTCAQYSQQHSREPLQPYPVPTLPWQLVSQDLFQLDGVIYLVTVDHYSDFYEIDKLPNLQSSAVIQATKKHFSRHGVPHTLITDNGTQFTSDLFKRFASKYKFHHITSSPYWSQSNGRAEAAVKSAKHILLTADDVDLSLLSVRNTAPAGHTFSPAQRLFGRALRMNLPQPVSTLQPSTPPPHIVVNDHVNRKLQQKHAYDKRAGPPLVDIPTKTKVFAKPPPTSNSKAWIPGEIIGPAGPRSYMIKTGPSIIRRNRVQVQAAPFTSTCAADETTSDEPTVQTPIQHNLVEHLSPPSPESIIPTTSEPYTPPATPSTSDSNPPSLTQQPAPYVSAAPTTTRSGRVIRRPARYSD